MQNPIGEADLEWILHRNCEGTEQLRYFLNELHAVQVCLLYKIMNSFPY